MLNASKLVGVQEGRSQLGPWTVLTACEWFRDWLSVLPQYAVRVCVWNTEREFVGLWMVVWLRDFTVVCDRWWKTASAEKRYSNLILENVKRVSGQSKASCSERERVEKLRWDNTRTLRAWLDLWRTQTLPFLFLCIHSQCSESMHLFSYSLSVIICQDDFMVSWISHYIKCKYDKPQLQKTFLSTPNGCAKLYTVFIAEPYRSYSVKWIFIKSTKWIKKNRKLCLKSYDKRMEVLL